MRGSHAAAPGIVQTGTADVRNRARVYLQKDRKPRPGEISASVFTAALLTTATGRKHPTCSPKDDG